MSAKIIRKKQKLTGGMKDEKLGEMFNQMLGEGAVNMQIAYKRYKAIQEILTQLLNMFDIFVECGVFNSANFASHKKELRDYIDESRKQLTSMFSVDYSQYSWNYALLDKLTDEEKKEFTTIYNECKKSDLINTFIILCDKLVPYKRHIGDVDKLSYKFIVNMAGAEFRPIPFCGINLKQVFCSTEVKENVKSLVLTVLHKAYIFSYRLYDEVNSPDINIDDFVDFIMNNIKEIQKQPELSRCKEAFDKIAESVDLLKTRFNGYYRDYVQTGNNTIMMEHFLLDVSTNTKNNPVLASQFRRIISYYRKVADQSANKDPKMKMLFEKVQQNFNSLRRNTENLDKEGTYDDTETDENNTNVESEEDVQAKLDLERREKEYAEKSVDDLVAEIEKAGSNVGSAKTKRKK